MTSGNFDTAFKMIIGEEGGFVNDPNDRGGATKYGVTQKVLEAWRRHAVSVDDVRKLGIDEAKLIFKAQYWSKVQGDKLPPGLDLAVVDTAYNSGPGRAVSLLQKAVGASADGVMGEFTLAAIAKVENLNELIDEFCDARLAFLKTTYGWAKYKNGWSNRVLRVRAAAHAMVDAPAAHVATLVDIPPMEGERADHNQKLTLTPAGQAKVVAAVGTLGTAATDAASKLEPFVDWLPTMKWLFLGLTIVGVAAGFYVQLRQLGQEAAP